MTYTAKDYGIDIPKRKIEIYLQDEQGNDIDKVLIDLDEFHEVYKELIKLKVVEVN